MLRWSAADLARQSGVGAATVRRYEMQAGIPSGNTTTLLTLKSTLERAGIEFTGDPIKDPGVILHLSDS